MKLAYITIAAVVFAVLSLGAYLKSTGMLLVDIDTPTGFSISLQTETGFESYLITIAVSFLVFCIGYRHVKGSWVWNDIKKRRENSEE